jgi:hypothetical protein
MASADRPGALTPLIRSGRPGLWSTRNGLFQLTETRQLAHMLDHQPQPGRRPAWIICAATREHERWLAGHGLDVCQFPSRREALRCLISFADTSPAVH